MSMQARIRQRSLFKKKLKMENIIGVFELSYGTYDEHYRLMRWKIDSHTLIYDKDHLARGIDFSIDNNDVILTLSLPTTKEEVNLFYTSIEKMCKFLKTDNYIIDGEIKKPLKRACPARPRGFYAHASLLVLRGSRPQSMVSVIKVVIDWPVTCPAHVFDIFFGYLLDALPGDIFPREDAVLCELNDLLRITFHCCLLCCLQVNYIKRLQRLSLNS